MHIQKKRSNDIGYNNAKYNYKSQTTFVESAYKHRHMATCSYCSKEEHLSLQVPINIRKTISLRIHFLISYVSR